MPSHTIPSALIKLYHTNGAPWHWTNWKEITGIHHGIFPTDDALLPKGFTRRDVIEIQSYFDQYNAQPTEDAKIKFASLYKVQPVPGRIKWRDWVTAGWKDWRIHTKITDVLTTEALHPVIIMANNKNSEWPQGETYLPLVVDAVAQHLFGDDSLDSSGRLAGPYRQTTQQLIQRSWINLHRQTKRNKTRLGSLEDATTRAFNGKGSFSCLLVFFFSSSIGVYAMNYTPFSLKKGRRSPSVGVYTMKRSSLTLIFLRYGVRRTLVSFRWFIFSDNGVPLNHVPLWNSFFSDTGFVEPLFRSIGSFSLIMGAPCSHPLAFMI